MSGQVGLPKPGEADPSIPLYDGEHDLATEFDEVAVSLRADVKRLAVGEADDLERDTVAWLRHLIETLDLALLVTGPEPGKDWNLIPFPDVGQLVPMRGLQDRTPASPRSVPLPSRVG